MDDTAVSHSLCGCGRRGGGVRLLGCLLGLLGLRRSGGGGRGIVRAHRLHVDQRVEAGAGEFGARGHVVNRHEAPGDVRPPILVGADARAEAAVVPNVQMQTSKNRNKKG